MAKKISLINKTKGLFSINFQGAFPINKWSESEKPIHLTEEEFEFVKENYARLLGIQLEVPKGVKFDPVDISEIDPLTYFDLCESQRKPFLGMLNEDQLKLLSGYSVDKGLENTATELLEDHIKGSK